MSRVLGLSIEHLSTATRVLLEDEEGPIAAYPLAYEYGWIIPVPEYEEGRAWPLVDPYAWDLVGPEDDERIPRDLMRIFEIARYECCDYVMISIEREGAGRGADFDAQRDWRLPYYENIHERGAVPAAVVAEFEAQLDQFGAEYEEALRREFGKTGEPEPKE